MMVSVSELPGYTTLPEPDLLFAGEGTHKHPLKGLLQRGPYGSKYGAPSILRLALLAPKLHMKKLMRLVNELHEIAKPIEAKNYYPDYSGFNEVFRIPIEKPKDQLTIEFPDQLETHARNRAKEELAKQQVQWDT